MTIGRLYQIPQESEPVFKTFERVVPEPEPVEDDAEKSVDDAEVKVVRRGRRPTPKATEGAETK